MRNSADGQKLKDIAIRATELADRVQTAKVEHLAGYIRDLAIDVAELAVITRSSYSDASIQEQLQRRADAMTPNDEIGSQGRAK